MMLHSCQPSEIVDPVLHTKNLEDVAKTNNTYNKKRAEEGLYLPNGTKGLEKSMRHLRAVANLWAQRVAGWRVLDEIDADVKKIGSLFAN